MHSGLFFYFYKLKILRDKKKYKAMRLSLYECRKGINVLNNFDTQKGARTIAMNRRVYHI